MSSQNNNFGTSQNLSESDEDHSSFQFSDNEFSEESVYYDENTENDTGYSRNGGNGYTGGVGGSKYLDNDYSEGDRNKKEGFYNQNLKLDEKDGINTELLDKLVKFTHRNYSRAIRTMATKNLESIEIDYSDLVQRNAEEEGEAKGEEEENDRNDNKSKNSFKKNSSGLNSSGLNSSELNSFEEFLNLPEIFLENFTEALTKVTAHYFPNYYKIKPKIYPRIINIPIIDDLRGLRNLHLGKLIRVFGVVTRRSSIFNLHLLIKYICAKCKASNGPFLQTNNSSDNFNRIKNMKCLECQSNGPFLINSSETIYRDFQKITIQEIPGTVPPGALPRSKEVYLFNDLIDYAKPGDEIDICGIYKNTFCSSLNLKNGFPVFTTMIEASSISKKINKFDLTEEDILKIKNLSKYPNIVEKLIESISPSIYGHKNIKMSILLAMLGGNTKGGKSPSQKNSNGNGNGNFNGNGNGNDESSLRIRGDINVLLLGDPGMAKSQFLRYVHHLSHRAVLATGQGSSGVGLTASVRRDPMLKEWTLEGGALVLADKGVCCIDEFDKMNEGDRVSIHEAMEQQSISIAKAGIVTSLHARCSVIAAANPIRGKYNSSLSFSQNVNLSDPIVSRFDLLCVVKDVIDETEDTRVAKFIINNHITGGDPTKSKVKSSTYKSPTSYKSSYRSSTTNKSSTTTTTNDDDLIEYEILKKYIYYAKNNFTPTISSLDIKKITLLYSDLRKESMHSGIPITIRHIESIVRISEAFAKARLSNYVSKIDINMAINATLQSFLCAQKYSVSKQLRKKFSKYFEENNDDLLIYLLKKMIIEKQKILSHNKKASYNNQFNNEGDNNLDNLKENQLKTQKEEEDENLNNLNHKLYETIKINASDFIFRCKQNEVKIGNNFFNSESFKNEGFVYSNEGGDNENVIKKRTLIN